MTIELRTQPIPDDIAEACAWLLAAERHDRPGGTLHGRLTAGDVLDVLTDIEPPYPPIDTSRPTAPLPEAVPRAVAALERALEMDLQPAVRLRVARALGALRQVTR